MRYKGYAASAKFGDDVGILHGEVVKARDVITFAGTSADEPVQAFHDSVADYLAFCKERREPPNKLLSS